MGFDQHYAKRAISVYTKHYGIKCNIDVIIEIIFRLQIKDKLKSLETISNRYQSRLKVIQILTSMGFSSHYILSAMASYETEDYFKKHQTYNIQNITQSIMHLRAKHRKDIVSDGNDMKLNEYNANIKRSLSYPIRTTSIHLQFPVFNKNTFKIILINGCCDDVSKCDSFQRINYVVYKYQIWLNNIKNNAIHTICEQYLIEHILDDYHHLMRCHHLEDIYNGMSAQCDVLSKCMCLKRNYRDRNAANNSLYFGVDIKDINFEQIMDIIHCYIMHCFDLHLSFTNTEWNAININKNCDEKKNDAHTHKIHKMREIINTKKRYKLTKNSKFQSKMRNDNVLIHNLGIKYNYYNKTDTFYIKTYYKSLKEELLNHIKMISHFNVLYVRAQHMKYKQHSKLFKAEYNTFGIQYSSCLDTNHILSLMIYCNYETVSSSLRQTYTTKDKQCIKQHSKYAHLAQNIFEMIQVFGNKTTDTDTFYHIFRGCMPFFGFKICICAPLSTTNKLQVILSYNNCQPMQGDGIIVGFKDNNTYFEMKYFQCQWLSDFSGEKEIVFDGNQRLLHEFKPIKIIDICDWSDYSEYLQSVFIIKHIFSSQMYANMDDINEYRISMILYLLRYGLNINRNMMESMVIPQYIKKWIQLYFVEIRIIRINLEHINAHYNFIKSLLCFDDFIDMNTLLVLFKNATNIIIDCAHKICLNELILHHIYLCLKSQDRSRTLKRIEIKQIKESSTPLDVVLTTHKKMFSSINCKMYINRKNNQSLSVECNQYISFGKV